MTKSIKKSLSMIALFLLLPFMLVITACQNRISYNDTYEHNNTHHWQTCKTQGCNEMHNYAEHNIINGVCESCKWSPLVKTIIGETTKYFDTFQEAIDISSDSSITNIYLLKDSSGDGFMVVANKNVVIDLNCHTYNVNGELVGSSATKTQAIHLSKLGKLTLKNGKIQNMKIKAGAAEGTKGCAILIQNYGELILEDVVLNANAVSENELIRNCGYVISNNFGSLLVKGNTQIIAQEGFNAFDMFYGLFEAYYDGVYVEFDESFTGLVDGKIEYGASVSANTYNNNWENSCSLIIKGGTFTTTSNINFILSDAPNIKIYAGSFGFDVSQYVADGYESIEDVATGVWSVSKQGIDCPIFGEDAADDIFDPIYNIAKY